jgi:hypothetical protein
MVNFSSSKMNFMKQILTLVAVLLTTYCSMAQGPAMYNGGGDIRRGRVKVHATDSPPGYIRSSSDSTIQFAQLKSMLKDIPENHPLEISYRDIDEVYVHRAGSTWKGMGIGAASGALTGLILGEVFGHTTTTSMGEIWGIPIEETTTKQQYVAMATVGGTLAGVIIGTIAGALAHKKFIIQGRKDKFREMQRKAKILP